MLRHCFFVFSMLVALLQISAAATPKSSPDQFVDQIIANERALSSTMRNYSPMVETYLQRLQQNPNLGLVPVEDHYFLGRVQFEQSKEEFYLDKRLVERMAGAFSKLYSLSPVGFASMIFVDRSGFDRKNYQLRYVQSEFLGEIRCLVYEISPRKDQG